MEIRCKKGDCSYNTGTSCKAPSVKIENDTAACETYNPDAAKDNPVIKDGNLFSVSQTLPSRNTNNVPLKCKAKRCLFNKSEKCVANGITVIDSESSANHEDASCGTFIKN